MRIGVICPSEIALRRFMPALQNIKELEFIGVGMYSAEERFGTDFTDRNIIMNKLESEYKKACVFTEKYGGKIFNSYESIVTSNEIDVIYIPLPPALHFKWANMALEYDKHVIVEKPATISMKKSFSLVKLARDKSLAFHENYMFTFHAQVHAIDEIIRSGKIGDVRLYRISFGFPKRKATDFRFSKELGGGALLDAGGYTIKYASWLLGESAQVCYAQINYIDGFEVDMYGSAVLKNKDGLTVQTSFGMDNSYKCELEVWGSKGCLSTDRILTAPVGFKPQIIIQKDGVKESSELPEDDAFGKSLKYFVNCIRNDKVREENYNAILKQAELIEQFKLLANKEQFL